MRVLIDPSDKQAQAAPAAMRSEAIARRKKILKIVWDEDEGFMPDHSAYGTVEWTVRPFEQGQRDAWMAFDNIHLIALLFCQQLGLNYAALYQQVYADDGESPGDTWLDQWPLEDQVLIEAQTVIPELSALTLRRLLNDLGEINHHSLAEALANAFTYLGYDIEQWWKDERLAYSVSLSSLDMSSPLV